MEKEKMRHCIAVAIGVFVGLLLVTIGFFKLCVVVACGVLGYFSLYLDWREIISRITKIIKRSHD